MAVITQKLASSTPHCQAYTYTRETRTECVVPGFGPSPDVAVVRILGMYIVSPLFLFSLLLLS